MLDQKRVQRGRDDVLSYLWQGTGKTNPNYLQLRDGIDNPPTNEHREFALIGDFSALGPFAAIPYYVKNDDIQGLETELAFYNSLYVMFRHLRMAHHAIDPTRSRSLDRSCGERIAIMTASGWLEDVADILEPAFVNNSAFKKIVPPYHKPSESKAHYWFAMLSARAALDIGGEVKVKLDIKTTPIWAMFMQKWDDPDPAAVRNVALACHEQLIAKAMIPEAKRPEFAEDSILFFDYDLRALNVLRVHKGLDPVEVETYCPPMPPLGKIPFARDDVFWPVYLDVCARLGIEPRFQDREYIDVSLNWETGLVERGTPA